MHSEALLAACLGRAAALEVAAGRLARAERAAHSALAVAEGRSGRWSAGAAWACAALAAVHWLRGELDQAEARADLGSAAAHGSGDLLAARALRAVRGHLAIARGDLAGGCASLATAGLHAEDGAGILPGWLDALGPARWTSRSPWGARGAWRPRWPGSTAATRSPRCAASSRCSSRPPRSIRRCGSMPPRRRRRVASGRPPDRPPTSSSGRSSSRRWRAVVSRSRVPASRCSRSSSGTSRCRRPGPRWSSELLGSIAGADPAATLTEPLSDRERDVLRLLPTLLRTPEIAGELFVSINTVKTHIKSIYRKLGVSSRRDAVARGRELRLI